MGGVGEVANVAWLGALEAVFKVMGDELALGNIFFFEVRIFFFEVANVAWLEALIKATGHELALGTRPDKKKKKSLLRQCLYLRTGKASRLST